MKRLLILPLMMGAVFFPSTEVLAQSSSAVNSAKIIVLERQVQTLRTRLGINPAAPNNSQGITAQPANQRLVADLLAKVGALEAQIRRMNGRLEEFEYAQRQMQEALEAMQKDMSLQREEFARAGSTGVAGQNARPSGTGAVAATSATGPANNDGGETLAEPETPSVRLPTGDAAEQYKYAFAFVRKNDLTSGRLALEQFVAANTGDVRIGDAKFWLGRIHLREGRNGQAAQHFLALIEDHPNHAKRTDALVDLADVLIKLDGTDDACNALAEFRRVGDKASARVKTRADRLSQSARCN
ncbi:MAG: hypothetical protein COB37_03935 [Kordiimonadales bacterium]|nr:MAG: hypothetical protein COB37_03935 [Kordiimonadales bacterium]